VNAAPGGAAWEALGTGVVLRVSDGAAVVRARAAVEAELDAIDRALSRFRPDSELSLANAHAGRSIKATALFIDALELALRAAVLTDGDVDPTLGRALELVGYDRDHRLLDPPMPERPTGPGAPPAGSAERAGEQAAAVAVREPHVWLAACARAGWSTVSVDRANGAIRTAPGIKLDLGATAKAWAADRAAEAAARAGGCGALVSVGGDIATSGPAPDGGWQVHVTDDHRSPPSARGQTITIDTGGLATSSTAVRRWSHGGRSNHHILDPRTGAPAESCWRTVSVAAASCADANIASTAAIIRGAASPAWLRELGLPARLVDRAGRVTTVGDWPAGADSQALGDMAA
jgi:thiamine biosynthesis lipoprotein